MMKVMMVGHAYAASYNRRDKLYRLANHDNVTELAAVIPNKWFDRMMGTSREYEKIQEDGEYRIYLLDTVFSGSQMRHMYLPWKLNSAIREFNPDIIHVEQEMHDWVLSEIVQLNKRVWKKPLVTFGWENLVRSYDPITALFRRGNIQSVQYAIGGNLEALDILHRDGLQSPSSVIPQFGVDEGKFTKIDTTSLKKELDIEGKQVLGFVGRFVEEKGIHTLIDGVEKLHADVKKNFVLILLSSMEPPMWLSKKIESMDGLVMHISSVPHEEFPKYMNLFDVLILPSETQKDWKEQFGRVMIEAMACEVPVIGSSSGAIPEVISDVGLVFKEGDSVDLALKIEEIFLESEKLQSLSKKSREHIMAEYTHDRVVEKTVEIYKELLGTI